MVHSDELSCYYQNTRGLRGKIKDGIKNNITLANYDAVSLTETWLNDNFSSSELFDDSYNVFRADRSVDSYNRLRANRADLPEETNVFGGGCLIALKNNISALRMNVWENEVLFDNIWLKLNTSGHSKIYLHSIYIPGWANYEQVNQYFEQLFDIINHREPYARFIIMGDFNLPHIESFPNGNHCIPITYEGRLAADLINTLTASNMSQFNMIRNKLNRMLDLILSNTLVTVTAASRLIQTDDHHPPLKIKFDRSDIKFLRAKKTPKLNYFKSNYDELNREIAKINWQQELNFDVIDHAVDRFYSLIMNLIKKHTPLTKPKSDDFPKWYSHDLIQMIKDKNYYRERMNGSSGEMFRKLFTEKTKEVKRTKRKCLEKYEDNIESKKLFCLHQSTETKQQLTSINVLQKQNVRKSERNI